MTTTILTLPIVTLSATTSQDGDCLVAIPFAASGVPIDTTGIAFSMAWRPVLSGGQPDPINVSLSASTTGSYLTNGNTTGILSLDVPVAKMQMLAAGTYAADIVATADGYTIVVGQCTFTQTLFGPCEVTALTSASRTTPSA